MAGSMLKRFSLYGFLKNQQYYDPFFLLALQQMGVSYTWFGLLIAFRELSVNLMEIPSGAIADVFGRRKAMIFSFVAYILSFAVFGGAGLAVTEGELSQAALNLLLLAAIFLFAVGDAFRTGTHKAMIFAWLRSQGRLKERTKVYGYTRSWSKIGSALSVLLACIFVFTTNNFIYIFFFAIIPYILNIINFLGYPAALDGDIQKAPTMGHLITHLKESLLVSVRRRSLRRLILESMGFEGFFKAAKDYLQPILMVAAIGLTANLFTSAALTDTQKSVILIGPVFFVIYLFSALASRKAHALVAHHGHEDIAARWLWAVTTLVFVVMLPGLYYGLLWVIIPGFAGLYIMQNLWRPILISRFDSHSDEAKGATVLSIESQAKSVATMIIAPLLGLAIDFVDGRQQLFGEIWGESEFWPIGIFGSVIAFIFLVSARIPSKDRI